jgi:hypothetical protein
MHFTSLFLSLLPLALVAAQPVKKDNSLAKRQTYSGRATFYDVGLGACGGYNVASDYIVALNTAQYGGGYPGPNCGRSITISANGVTVQATIQDQCPSCDYGALDLSRSLFQRFASEDKGTFQMSWWYNDGNSQPQPKPEPKTSTYTPPPPPTSTWTPPTSTWTPPTSTSVAPTSTWTPPTSTWVAPTTSSAAAESSSSSTSTVFSSTDIASSMAASASALASGITTNGTVLPFAVTTQISNGTATASGASEPVQTGSPLAMSEIGNLAMFNQAVTYLGNIIVVGAGGE